MKPVIRSVSKQSGITMIEVMIAMLIGLVLMGGVMQIFASSRHTYRMHEATSRMQETGRMALEMISRDIRMADFWGCASDIVNVTNGLDTAGAGFIDFSSGGIAGVEGGAGPDSLTLRGGTNAGVTLLPPFGPLTSSPINIPAGNTLQQGDVVFVADCESADVFQISNADPDTTGVLQHDTSGSTSPGNDNVADPTCAGANAHCLSKIYGADATVFTTNQTTYTIGAGSEGQPALFRNGLEFLDGVEDMQILYGEDLDAPGTPGAGVANYYVPANQVADMNNVISIRVAIVTRSYDDNLTSNANQAYSVLGINRVAPDERLRQVYTSTINVRNRL